MSIEFSVVMPCLNEERTIGICIEKAKSFFDGRGIEYEIIVADNGSEDDSIEIGRSLGAKVIDVVDKGYGNALRAGINQSCGVFVIMGDSDDSYDFSNLSSFVDKLREGYELVMGNRFLGGIEPNAMPNLHRYLGNPVLSFFGRFFFKVPIRDFHCGLRGFNRERFLELGLECTGMEFASEVVVKATLKNLRITEVPVKLYRDGRDRPPHLRSWRDGWRHLRFLLMFCPNWLFLYPGFFLLISGFVILFALQSGPFFIGMVGFDVHTMLYGSAFTVIGVQMVLLSYATKKLGAIYGLLDGRRWHEKFDKQVSLEHGLLAGVGLFLLGAVWSINLVVSWGGQGFGALEVTDVMRSVILAVTVMVVGVQVCISSFFLGIVSFLANDLRVEK